MKVLTEDSDNYTSEVNKKIWQKQDYVFLKLMNWTKAKLDMII
jgi:hypothetical protein